MWLRSGNLKTGSKMSLSMDCIKSLASKDDIHSLKSLLIEQKSLITVKPG